MNSSDRMTTAQLERLALAICATAETLGYTLSAEAAELMAEDLADYPAKDVGAALQACRRELTGKLTLAAILQRVKAADGRPSDDEAWAIALCASDESDSVVMTDEIHLALNAARAVLESGDKIGARMAFKAAYLRAVDNNRRQAVPAKWTLSMGSDPQRRLLAVQEAGRQGRLPAPVVQEYVAQLTHGPITSDGQAIAGLLTGNVVKMSPQIREKWQAVKAEVNRNAEAAKAKREAEQETKRAELAAKKAEAAKALAELEARSMR